MSEPLVRLEARVKLAGWTVSERQESPADAARVREVRWLLTSARSPQHAQAELRMRVMVGWYYGDYWDQEPYYFNDYLTGVTIRSPQADSDATPEAEATLVGDEIARDNYRQLVRILEWFRDPLSGDFWLDPPLPGEWEPPPGLPRAGRQAAFEPRWVDCRDGWEMLRLMPGKASDRKLRLIACGCARLLIVPNLQQRNRNAIDSAERHAEGLCPRKEMKKFCKHSDLAWLAQREAFTAATTAISVLGQQTTADAARAADVVREILGNPFRPVTLRHEWLRNEGRAVAHLAAAIHDEGRYEDMPILADALEDAGCTVAAVLDHCRAPVRHARGCWVLDLVLGKT